MLVSYNEEVIMREVDLKRIRGSSASPFKRQDIMYLNSHIKEPIKTIDYSKNLCPILIYEEINRKYPYILSIDPSEGLALDNNAFTLINPYTQCAAAEFKSPYISQSDLTALAIKFLDEYCPKSMIVVEANKGRETINRFLESKYRNQLYYDIDKLNSKVVDRSDEYGALKQAAYERRAYGFDTTPSSRPKLFTILENFVEEKIDKLYTKYIVDDIVGLERKTSGRIEAGGESHDDNIMSYLIGLYVYFHASNLEEFGIHRGQMIPEGGMDKPKTINEVKKALMGISQNLPDNLREVFISVINEKDPVDDAWEYQKKLQREIQIQDMVLHPNKKEEDTYYAPDESDAIWGNLDRSLIESNFDTIERTNVNIEDWID